MVGRPKDQSAFALLQVLRKGLAQPDDVAARFLCGLMTSGEIEYLLKRDEVHKQVVDSLAATGSLSMQAVATKCECGTELVGRVWDAICNEYPSENAASAKSRIAIPKEDRAQNLVKEILAEGGFRIDIQDRRTRMGVVVDMRENIAPLSCQIIAGQDIFKYLSAGSVQAAFIGNDKIKESAAASRLEGQTPIDLSIKGQFSLNAFRMCLAIPKGERKKAEAQGIGYFEDKVIATSYVATLKEFLGKKGVEARGIISLKGGVEQALGALGAHAIMDIVETGISLKANGLVPFGRPLYPGDMSFVSLKGTRCPEGTTRFVERLGTKAAL